MGAVYPAETPPCSWSPFAAGRVVGWRRTTQLHCHSRVVICNAFVASPVFEPRARVAILSGGFGYGLYEGSTYCKTELLTRRYIEASQRRNSAAESTSVAGSNCCFRIGFKGEVRDFNTSAFQFSEHGSTMSPSREDSLSTEPASARIATSEHGRPDARSPRRPQAQVSAQKPRG
jgi:hypothetical protein